ncbi:MAG: hypothetical protein Q4G70_08790 [Pseudomonadota bacterium]|nr:hypothetical protein [Pseudomonadota bacterium]
MHDLHPRTQRRIWPAIGIAALAATLAACGSRPEPFDPGQIVATEVIPPGQPMAEFNLPTIVREGTGEPLQVGDFVMLHRFEMDRQTGKIVWDRSQGWAWLGFLNQKETPFFTCWDECEVDSAMVGMKVGTVFKYDEADLRRLEPQWKGKPPRKYDGGGSRMMPGGGFGIPIGDVSVYRKQVLHQTLELRKTVHTLPGYLQAQLMNIEGLIFKGPNNDRALLDKSVWRGYAGGVEPVCLLAKTSSRLSSVAPHNCCGTRGK